MKHMQASHLRLNRPEGQCLAHLLAFLVVYGVDRVAAVFRSSLK